jgi:hypothetical protein
MNRFGFALIAALVTVTIACKRQNSDGAAGSGTPSAPAAAPAEGSGSAAPAAAAPAAPAPAAADPAAPAAGAAAPAAGAAAPAEPSGGAAAAADGMAHRAGMCPSMVLGATTKQAIKGKAVVVTIESTDKDAIAAVQKRADKLLAERASGPTTGVGHDQKGVHGGSQGLCPVHVPEGATATAKHEAKGVVVTITPKDKPDELSKEIDGRIARAADWTKANVKDGDKGNQGGVGGGKGEDGSNHSGKGDGKGHERKKGDGGGKGTGGGGGAGTGGGDSKRG